MSAALTVDRLESLSPEDFAWRYVAPGRPVLITGGLKDSVAYTRWTLDYLDNAAGEHIVGLKSWQNTELRVTQARLTDYIDSLRIYEAEGGRGSTLVRPAYLHDVPLTSVLPEAAADLSSFQRDFFPSWYGAEWVNFAQLFLGPSGSVTPLHFDCLLTHNLFFQVSGKKLFTLLPFEDLKWCYAYDWRWCEVNVEQPDFDRHPLYRNARQTQVTVEAGDILYMPPGMLHHVRSVDSGLSFNVDWHTAKSALRGVSALACGMPYKNVYYNLIVALGLCGGVSAKRLFPFYRSYLNYVS
jgi:ribosomal protein L16 Arg81 hydroxylase